MKYITLAILLTLLLSMDSRSQIAFTKGNNYSEDKLYQNYPNPFKDITLIEFSVKQDNLVKLYVTDTDGNYIETLVEGEVDEGKHSVYFKAAEGSRDIQYKCKLEIYNEDRSSKTYSEEVIMNSKVYETSGIK